MEALDFRTLDFRTLDLRDALDLAIAMEEEAQARYEEFTRLVGGRYPGDAAEMFRTMAGYERKHGAELLSRRHALFGDAPRRVTMDLLDDAEAPDRGKPRVFMGPRQALEVALASEQKAYDFFDGALRQVADERVRQLFEELRDEEARHAAMVKERLEKLPPGPDLTDDEADAPGSDPGN